MSVRLGVAQFINKHIGRGRISLLAVIVVAQFINKHIGCGRFSLVAVSFWYVNGLKWWTTSEYLLGNSRDNWGNVDLATC
jgi:hypothetical protein